MTPQIEIWGSFSLFIDVYEIGFVSHSSEMTPGFKYM